MTPRTRQWWEQASLLDVVRWRYATWVGRLAARRYLVRAKVCDFWLWVLDTRFGRFDIVQRAAVRFS